MENLNIWAENFTKEVYETWKEKYSFWESGFKTFYGRVSFNPTVMILTMQPGGDQINWYSEDKYRFENGDFSPPKINAYIENNNQMARRMKDLFASNIKLLEESVTIPLNFFRATSGEHWSSIEETTRIEMEYFCFNKIKELLKIIKPKIILVHGIQTYNLLKEILGGFQEQTVFPFNGKVIIRKTNFKGIKIFGILHPTGYPITNEAWAKIKEEFHKELGNLY